MSQELAFIELTLGNQTVWHGYDQLNQKVVERVEAPPTRKVIAVSRILSIDEQHIVVTSGFGRLIYWEYHDGYENLKQRLELAGLLIDVEQEEGDEAG
ncbi:MAG TPA: hypothetical protein VFP68_15490 [Burkholderiaceae bacterium]|nr:hypothetical protein [Burkholderiaceae bacterium]